MARFVVVIGANGAGKSAWCRENRGRLPKRFLNADMIAAGLGDPDYESFQIDARDIVDDTIRRHVKDGNDHGLETVYSGEARPDLVRQAHARGDTTEGIYLATSDPRVNLARIELRVASGGHGVPEDVAIQRWAKTQANVISTWDDFDRLEIYDADCSPAPRHVATKDGDRFVVHIDDGDIPPHLRATVRFGHARASPWRRDISPR